MKLNSLFPSKYLRAADLDGDTPVTMKSLMIEEVNGENKPVLHFIREEVKPMVLNKTNGKMIGSLHGSETDNWPGKKITLFPTEVDFRGEVVDAIRIRRQIPDDGEAETSKQNDKDGAPF